MALAILVGGLLYLGRYQDRMVATELDSLTLQSRIIASAVAENAVVVDEDDASILSPMLARLMVRRLAETTETRTRLFDLDGTLLADSHVLLGNKVILQTDNRDTSSQPSSWLSRQITGLFNHLDGLHERNDYPLLTEQAVQRGEHYDSVRDAAKGSPATQVWRTQDGPLTLAAAVPVQHAKRSLGVVMMSRSDDNVDRAISTVRIDILEIFGVTLCITILLSLYLARAIARPIRLLAMAAEGLRHGQMHMIGLAGTARLLNKDAIPDMTDRRDEIGDLSGALRDLTSALAQRIGAIENFAADVAHEIKNPLTSLRSAVETVERVQDPVAHQTLMRVIRDDVDRLDRLITDIAHASRLDAELSRDEATTIDIIPLLTSLIDGYNAMSDSFAPVKLMRPPEALTVIGLPARLAQVFQNVVDNALSFAPAHTAVTVAAFCDGDVVRIMVEDCGPGIPPNKLASIFDRFYSERPKDEKFGTHSGLGLSISKQIIEAHRGTIYAENRTDADGHIIGARFVVNLPAG